MGIATFGEKDWEEAGAGGGGGRTDFFNMKDDGQYAVRIVGKPHEFAKHWVEGGGKRLSVNCAGRDCVLCKAQNKATIRYLVPIILRKGPGVDKAGQIAVTEFGPQVYNAIRSLFKTPEWGNPTSFDMMIDKNKKRGAAGTYFVTPLRKIALTDQEKADVREFMETIDLKKFSAPLQNDEIVEKLGKEVCAALGISVSTGNSSAGGKTAADPDLDFGSDDGEYSFDA
jgi:hypothetical protein